VDVLAARLGISRKRFQGLEQSALRRLRARLEDEDDRADA
jgi:DNA-directed RNA polymerase sigma subunit (sigma70/sigma32)